MERLLERGDMRAALSAAEVLLRNCLEAGETAYPLAAYDLAMAHATLGRALQRGGAASQALQPLGEAQRRFEALATCEAALQTFESLGEPRSVATVWHQIGIVHRRAGQNELAERAYRQARAELLRSLKCKEPHGHASGPWMTWNILQRLETSTGNSEAAARARAFESYLAYRREGGYGTTPAAQDCAAAARTVAAGDTSDLEQYFSHPPSGEALAWTRVVFPKLLAAAARGA